jgi:hypothetical protein
VSFRDQFGAYANGMKIDRSLGVGMKGPRPAPRGKKTVYFEAGVWFDEEQGHIHLSIPADTKFHTTVSNDPTSKRYHPNLFKKLKMLLQEHGRWPV